VGCHSPSWWRFHFISDIIKTCIPLLLLLYGSFVLNARIDAEEEMYSVNLLFIGIFSNGDVLVQDDIRPKVNVSEFFVKLLGQNVTNLSIKNYSSHDLSYYVNVKSNELRIKPQGSSQIRITYETSTLVDKVGRLWTFSVNSTSTFTLKLPNDAVVTSLGEHVPRLIRRLGGQELLTFDPGRATVKYILGYIGTKEQAETAIYSAEIDIANTEKSHQGIRLNEALKTLDQSKIAMNRGNFPEAESLATNATDLINNLSRDFELAKNALNIATAHLKDAQINNLDTSQADKFISESKSQFGFGNYTAASEFARMARESIVSRAGNNQQNFTQAVAIVSGIVLIIAFVLLLYFKKFRYIISIGYQKKILDSSRIGEQDDFRGIRNEGFHLNDEMARDSISDAPENVSEEVSQPKQESEIYRHVDRIILEHHDLKTEDREVLYFLAHNEGAAFEGEIRTKFLLPKTSIWRLVKRLERLELIEIAKVGGQNLIKLKIQ
jgi:uncharacterized membrane protein